MRTLVLSLTVSGILMIPLQLDAGTASGTLPPQANGQAGKPVPQQGGEVDASSLSLPCIPVAAYWTGPPQSDGMPPGPELAIVSTDVRPKDARVHLDDRFVGRARYLDGKPGYLYLAPGPYRLELRLEGYLTLSVELQAAAGCRYDLKHRLARIKGASKEDTKEGYGKGKPFHRVYAPIGGGADRAATQPHANPALRPDLEAGGAPDGPSSAGAALRLIVTPESASVAIDGEFVATARELGRMQGPLATTVGIHRITLTAPGFRTIERTVELAAGERLELVIEMTRDATTGGPG